MGRVKALMMEMEEHGYDFFKRGEKYVCSHHFEDKYLNGYIKKYGETGVCSYCGHKETVIDMSDLADHIGMTISVYLMMLILSACLWRVHILTMKRSRFLV